MGKRIRHCAFAVLLLALAVSSEVDASPAPPTWVVPYGAEFWQPSTGVNPGRVAERVSHAITAHPPIERPFLRAAHYTVELDRNGFTIAPGNERDWSGPVSAAIATEAEARRDWWIIGNTAQRLLDETSGMVEHVQTGSAGVELTWILPRRPKNPDRFRIVLSITGLTFGKRSASGLHFADTDGTSRLLFGPATAVDSAGRRTELATAVSGDRVTVSVPRELLETASYPLAIDPLLGPDLGSDTPLDDKGGLVKTDNDMAYAQGVFLVVWTDERNQWSTEADIYAARVAAADGQVLDPDGIPLSTTATAQTMPRVASNSTDFLVVWEDKREDEDYEDEIYGARISGADGSVLDPDGFVIGHELDDQTDPQVAAYGDDYFVIWLDDPLPDDYWSANVIGARVLSADGTVEDPWGIDIATDARFTGIASDGTNLLVAWSTCASSEPFTCEDQRIWATRIDGATGTALDDPPLELVASDDGLWRFTLASSGDGFLLVWMDYGLGDDLFGARLDATGALLDTTPITVSSAGWEQGNPRAASNGTDYLVVWRDNRNSSSWDHFDIYAARVQAADGAVLEPDGVPLSELYQNQEQPSVASDGSDYFVAWQDGRYGYFQIFGARVAGVDGTVVDPDGIPVAAGLNYQDGPAIASNGTDFLVVWDDTRTIPESSIDVYGARVQGSDGQILDPDGIAISTADYRQGDARVASNGEDYLVVWSDHREGDHHAEVYGARVDADGAVLDPEGILICEKDNPIVDIMYPSVASDGDDYLAVWSGQFNGDMHTYGARVGSDGTLVDEEPLHLSYPSWDNEHWPVAVASNGDGYLVVWRDYNAEQLDAVLVGSDGEVLAESDLIGEADEFVGWIDVATDGTNYLAIWHENPVSNTQVHGALINGQNLKQIGLAEFPISSSYGYNNTPMVTSNGEMYLVVWARGECTERGVLAARVTTAGGTLEPDGFLVDDDSPRFVWARAAASADRLAVSYAAVEDDSQRVRTRFIDLEACEIDGIPHVEGAVNPENTCQACVPEVATDEWTTLEDGVSCDDGSSCVVGESCTAGVCEGTPVDCSELDGECEVGFCDEETGDCLLEVLEDGASCDDGDECTSGDACYGGACAGSPKDCGDSADQCNTGECNLVTGACEAIPVEVGTPCDDGDPETSKDACQAGGICVGVPPAETSSRGCRCSSAGPTPRAGLLSALLELLLTHYSR